MQLARKVFQDFVQLPRKLRAGLAPSFAEARKHALKNILRHRRLPRSFENYLDHPLPSGPQTYLLHGATMLLEHIAAQVLHTDGMHRICTIHTHLQLASPKFITNGQYLQYSQPPQAGHVAPFHHK